MKAAGIEHAAANPKETIEKLKELDIFKSDENMKILDGGFLTFIDLTPK